MEKKLQTETMVAVVHVEKQEEVSISLNERVVSFEIIVREYAYTKTLSLEHFNALMKVKRRRKIKVNSDDISKNIVERKIPVDASIVTNTLKELKLNLSTPKKSRSLSFIKDDLIIEISLNKNRLRKITSRLIKVRDSEKTSANVINIKRRSNKNPVGMKKLNVRRELKVVNY